jgi:hypothetical protein
VVCALSGKTVQIDTPTDRQMKKGPRRPLPSGQRGVKTDDLTTERCKCFPCVLPRVIHSAYRKLMC